MSKNTKPEEPRKIAYDDAVAESKASFGCH